MYFGRHDSAGVRGADTTFVNKRIACQLIISFVQRESKVIVTLITEYFGWKAEQVWTLDNTC